ncbi:hypothetical protein ACJJTC_019774 [Scirpophaga incertulas]
MACKLDLAPYHDALSIIISPFKNAVLPTPLAALHDAWPTLGPVPHPVSSESVTSECGASHSSQRRESLESVRSLHSLTETARLLHNVRNVFTRRSTSRARTDLELSHGFAFSQEEGGSVSQADVIRAYDTSQPRPEHS